MTIVIDTLTTLGLPAHNLTFEQGMQALNSLSNNGLDQVDRTVLRDLVNRISADAPGSVTVMYSGAVNSELGLKPLTIINAMKNNGDDIRTIQDSPANKFLNNVDFRESLAQSLGVELKELDLRGTAANDFLEGPQGLWGDVSANFIDATKGDIVTLTGGAADDRIFSQRELERIQANEKITSVDGLDRTHLSNMTQEQAYKAIKAASDTRLADLNIVLDADGKPALYGRQIMIDSQKFFTDLGIEGHATSTIEKYMSSTPNSSISHVIDLVPAERWVEHTEGFNALANLDGYGRVLGKIGIGGTVLGMLVLNAQVKAAETPQQKQQVIDDWVAHTTADTIAGSIGSALLVGGATVALATITTLSSPVIIGLAIAGGIAGSVLWGDNVHDYIKDGVDRVIENIKKAIRDLIGNDTDLSEVANLYEEAEHITSPLILDLNRDGVVGTTALQNGVYFDHDGSGYKEKTGWVSQQDGLLVLDKNNSQNIESGQELFGNYTTLENGQFALNGFDALAAYDLNQDGVIDVSDDIYTHLQVWQDSNQDGQVDAGELKLLQEQEIQHINLSYTQRNNVDAQGNIHKQLGKFVWSDGTEGKIDDVWFKIDTLNSQVDKNKIIIVSDIIQALPDIQQFGNVDSLHQAMAKDSTGVLQQLVEQFVETDSLTLRQKLITDIIYQWTEVTDLPAHERGMYWDDRHLYALEKIMGHEYHSSADPERTLQVGNNQAYALEQAWKLLQQKIYDQLYIQIELPQIFNHIQIVQKNNAIETDLNQLYLYIKQQSITEIVELYDVLSRGPQLFHDIQNGLKQIASTSIHPDLIDQIFWTQEDIKNQGLIGTDSDEHISGYEDRNDVIYGKFGQDVLYGRSGSDQLYGDGGDDQLYGDGGDDLLYGSDGDDLLYGGDGDDMLSAGDGNDLLSGGEGNDNLDGGYGMNTYIFNHGDGQDTIQSVYLDENSKMIETYIQFNVLAENVTMWSLYSTDVVIQINNTNDRLQIAGIFNENSGFKTITFADQTVWTLEDIKNKNLLGDSGVNYLMGFENRDDYIYGYADIDILIGKSGDDFLYGGDGDDFLNAGDGNDLLNGGAGNDDLYGGYGINTYIFNHGDGQDTIQSASLDENSLLTETHILLGVLPNDIELEIQYSTDLLIKIKNTDDQLLIRDIFSADSIFKSLTFSDQSIWSLEDIKNFSLIGNEQDNFIEGYENRNNTIYGKAGNDTLYGQNGNDQLYGGNDDDYLVGNEGNDQLYGGSGTNILIGGKGDDQYVIENSTGEIIENAKEGIDTVQSSVSFTLGSYIENLALVGSSAINGIGNSLANTLKGNSANNTLNGGAGNDYIESGAGNDKLLGGNGKDVLNGGLGNDQYTGGTGADIVIYELLVSSDAVGGNGNDNWADFTVGNIATNVNADKIDISELIIGYTGNYSSSNLEPFIKTVINGSNTQLYIDRDGGGSTYNSSLFITLNNVNIHLNDLINNQQIIV